MSDPNDTSPGNMLPDAPAELKAGAQFTRASLHGRDAQQRNAQSPSSAGAMLAGTPLGAAIGAISSIPKEQMIEFVMSGLRSLLSQPAPVYRVRPATPPTPREPGEKS